jgi:hypothetical protein
MSEALLSLPEACQTALAAIEQDPLDLPAEVHAHLHRCPACTEARVQWLALEETPHALAPAGYFDRLPERIQRKLPAKPGVLHRSHKLLWAAAAALLMTGVGIGGFWLGKANKTPLVEATLPKMPASVREVAPENPFHEDDLLSQLSELTPEQAEQVFRRLEASPSAPAEQP